MKKTVEASEIAVGDQVRSNEYLMFSEGEWVTVIERNVFRNGTRIHIILADGQERTMVACTTTVIKRDET